MNKEGCQNMYQIVKRGIGFLISLVGCVILLPFFSDFMYIDKD